MASKPNEVIVDLSPAIKVYKDETIQRLWGSPYVPPSSNDPNTGVSSKDITISPQVSSRIYLPKLQEPTKKLPILVYYHCGGFCAESAFEQLADNYLKVFVSEASVVAVSVEYRLAPEHPLPAAYQDSWVALQWVASHFDQENIKVEKDAWLVDHGDVSRLFVGGDSAGGNIVHNMLLKAGNDKLHGDVKILGAILCHPYFWGSKPIGSMSVESHMDEFSTRIWGFVYPSAPGGIDNPMINPMVEGAPNLRGLGCKRLFVCVAEKDVLRERALEYVEAVKKGEWDGEVEVVDVEGEMHIFQVIDPRTQRAKELIKRMAASICQ